MPCEVSWQGPCLCLHHTGGPCISISPVWAGPGKQGWPRTGLVWGGLGPQTGPSCPWCPCGPFILTLPGLRPLEQQFLRCVPRSQPHRMALSPDKALMSRVWDTLCPEVHNRTPASGEGPRWGTAYPVQPSDSAVAMTKGHSRHVTPHTSFSKYTSCCHGLLVKPLILPLSPRAVPSSCGPSTPRARLRSLACRLSTDGGVALPCHCQPRYRFISPTPKCSREPCPKPGTGEVLSD